MDKLRKDNKSFKYLEELVGIPSYGTIGTNHQIIDYLRDAFKNCCEIEIKPDENGNVYMLIGVNQELKNIDNSIILSGHIDTVGESDNHECKIFLEDRNVKGLGVSDMKSFVAVIIANLDYLMTLDIPVIISLTSDEETKLLGVRKIIEKLKMRNINTNMVVVGEPTNLDYYVSSMGNSIYVSIMNGISCHSSTPNLGINAINLQADFISETEKVRKLHLNDASLCITHIDGGKVPSNVVPSNSSMCFSIRTNDSKVLNTMYDYLSKKHNEISQGRGESKLFNVLEIPPFERQDSDFLMMQAKALNKQMIDIHYSTEAGYFQKFFPNSNIVIYGPGNPDGIHSSKEILNLDNLFRYENEFLEFLDSYISYTKNEDKRYVKKIR